MAVRRNKRLAMGLLMGALLLLWGCGQPGSQGASTQSVTGPSGWEALSQPSDLEKPERPSDSDLPAGDALRPGVPEAMPPEKPGDAMPPEKPGDAIPPEKPGDLPQLPEEGPVQGGEIPPDYPMPLPEPEVPPVTGDAGDSLPPVIVEPPATGEPPVSTPPEALEPPVTVEPEQPSTDPEPTSPPEPTTLPGLEEDELPPIFVW